MEMKARAAKNKRQSKCVIYFTDLPRGTTLEGCATAARDLGFHDASVDTFFGGIDGVFLNNVSFSLT